MTGDLCSPLVERAMRFACRAHRDQQRKATDLPYISHPAGVALILARAGFADDSLLAAALLHDVVEDTVVSLERLGEEFPQPVLDYVAALTERKRHPDGTKRSWRTRKEEHLAHVTDAPLEVRAIVLADKLHNLSAMLYDLEAGTELWDRFNASPRDVLWYHRTMVASVVQGDERLQRLAVECRELLQRLERAVPEA